MAGFAKLVFYLLAVFFIYDVGALQILRAMQVPASQSAGEVVTTPAERREIFQRAKKVERQTFHHLAELRPSVGTDGRHVLAYVTVDVDETYFHEFTIHSDEAAGRDQRPFPTDRGEVVYGRNAYHNVLLEISSRYRNMKVMNKAIVLVDWANLMHGVAQKDWATTFRQELLLGKSGGTRYYPFGGEEISSENCLFVFPFFRRPHPDSAQKLTDIQPMLRELIRMDPKFSQRIIVMVLREDKRSIKINF